jgi:glycolate oxidase iron-sulfur subunit
MLRALLAWTLPHPGRFRTALALARLARPFRALFGRGSLGAMLALAPPRPTRQPAANPAGPVSSKGRIALLQGCAEPVLRPQIREATVRLLHRAGYEVVFAEGEVCCGSLVHHLGRKAESLDAARRNVDAWTLEIEGAGLDAIVITTSGCGVQLKDYGFLLREDPAYAAKAARVSALARDVSELLSGIELPPMAAPEPLRVAYHPACALQHGQGLTEEPKRLLEAAGFQVRTPSDAHLCCGSAGTYNILQPQIAADLGQRKVQALQQLEPDVIVAGNIGCMTQIGIRAQAPVVHTVELLDWAAGGPRPPGIDRR